MRKSLARSPPTCLCARAGSDLPIQLLVEVPICDCHLSEVPQRALLPTQQTCSIKEGSGVSSNVHEQGQALFGKNRTGHDKRTAHDLPPNVGKGESRWSDVRRAPHSEDLV